MFKWIIILSLSNNRDMVGGDEKVLGVVGGWAVRDVVVGGALDDMVVVVSVVSLKGNV
jgi:hypothetical protein